MAGGGGGRPQLSFVFIHRCVDCWVEPLTSFVHPVVCILLQVWAWLHSRGMRGTGVGFVVLFVSYVMVSWWLVVRAAFSPPLPPVLRVILTIEQVGGVRIT